MQRRSLALKKIGMVALIHDLTIVFKFKNAEKISLPFKRPNLGDTSEKAILEKVNIKLTNKL